MDFLQGVQPSELKELEDLRDLMFSNITEIQLNLKLIEARMATMSKLMSKYREEWECHKPRSLK